MKERREREREGQREEARKVVEYKRERCSRTGKPDLFNMYQRYDALFSVISILYD